MKSSDRPRPPAAAPARLADRAVRMNPATLVALCRQAGQVLDEHWALTRELFVLEGRLGALGELASPGVHYAVALSDGSPQPVALNIPGHLAQGVGEGAEVRAVGRLHLNFFRASLQFRLEVLELEALAPAARADRPAGLTADEWCALKSHRHPFPFGRQRLRVVALCGRGNAVFDDFRGQLGSLFDELVDLVCVEIAIADPGAIVAAIERAEADILVLIRGGGDSLDMSVFGDRAVLAAMAAKPCFRLAGIGHTRDTHLLDEVVDFAASTPTAAGRYVRDQLDQQRRFIARQHHEARRLADDHARRALEPLKQACSAAELEAQEARHALEHVKSLLRQRLEAPGADKAHIKHLAAANRDLRWQRGALALCAVLLVVAATTSAIGWSMAARANGRGAMPALHPALPAPGHR